MERIVIKVLIEKAPKGYSAYMDNEDLPFFITAGGDTVAKTKAKFEEILGEFRDKFANVIDNSDIEFSYDVASFLAFYKGILTLAGLSRVTGVSAGLLSQYINGTRNPSAKTVERISEGLRNFANELLEVNLSKPI